MFFAGLLALICSLSVTAQKADKLSISDFVGNWNVDMERTYSKSERKKVDYYRIQVLLNDKKLTIFWDSMMKGIHGPLRNYYHVDYIIDGKEKDLKKERTESGAWTQTASFNGKEIKCSYNYRVDGPTQGGYLDFQTFSFSADKRYLIVESVYRSAKRYAPSQTETRKLYFVKEN